MLKKYLADTTIILALISALLYLTGFTYEFELLEYFGLPSSQFVQYGPALIISGSNTISSIFENDLWSSHNFSPFWLLTVLLILGFSILIFRRKLKLENRLIIIFLRIFIIAFLIFQFNYLLEKRVHRVYQEYIDFAISDRTQTGALHKQKVYFTAGFDSLLVLTPIRYAGNSFAFIESKTARIYIINERYIKQIESVSKD